MDATPRQLTATLTTLVVENLGFFEGDMTDFVEELEGGIEKMRRIIRGKRTTDGS